MCSPSALQGELEGAKPASNRIKCRAKPCYARRARSEASIFVPLCGTKITALLQAVEKSRRLFRQPEDLGTVFRGPFLRFFCGKRSTRSATRSAYRLSGKRGEYPTGGATEGEGGDTTSVRLSFYTSCRNLSTGFFPQWRGKRRLSGWGRELFYCLYGMCQMVSAYWAMARSAANTPLRAMLVRLMRFHLVRSP